MTSIVDQYQYHHMGIPTTEVKPGEIYHAGFKFTSTPFLANAFRIQWHRFDEDSSLHPLIQSVPHVAFKVPSIEEAMGDYEVLLAPYEPIPGYKVVIVAVDGAPVAFVQTDLSDEVLGGYEATVAL